MERKNNYIQFVVIDNKNRYVNSKSIDIKSKIYCYSKSLANGDITYKRREDAEKQLQILNEKAKLLNLDYTFFIKIIDLKSIMYEEFYQCENPSPIPYECITLNQNHIIASVRRI